MSLWLSLTSLIFTTGICVLILGLRQAPFGREDETGFHATMRPVKVPRPASVPAPLTVPVRMHEMSGHV